MNARKTRLKNFLMMVSGNFGAQAVSLLFYPVLVRFFTPEDFAVFGTLSSSSVIFSIFAGGQLTFALLKTRNSREEMSEVLWLINRYAATGVIISFLIMIGLNQFMNIFDWKHLLLFPVLLSSIIFFDVYKMLAVCTDNYTQLSKTTTINRLGSNLIKLGLGFFSPTVWALVFSEVVANTFSVIRLRSIVKIRSLAPASGKALLKKYSHFPLFSTFSTFFQLGLLEVPVLFYASLFEKELVGVYVLVVRILLQPLAVIGNALGTVVSKDMSEKHDKKLSQVHLLRKIYSMYYFLGLVVFLFALFIPQEFYTWALGPKWDDFRAILLPLSLLAAAKLSSGLHIFHYAATERVSVMSFWKAAQLAATILIIAVFQDQGFIKTLWIVCATEAAIDTAFTLFTVLKQKKQ